MSFLEALPETLRRKATTREFAEGDLLFRQGASTEAIFEVLSGRLRLVRRTIDDHRVALHTARAGDLFAEAAVFSDVYHCDAVAAAPTLVRILLKSALLAVLRVDPVPLERFAARLARQVQGLRARLELRNVRSARQRVLQHLRLNAGPDGRTISVEGYLQDIAVELGPTREVIYRTLALLEAEGLIERRDLVIVLKKSSTA